MNKVLLLILISLCKITFAQYTGGMGSGIAVNNAGIISLLATSGNIEETAVTSCNAAGRSFTGVSGDGMLTASGDANTDFWPGINGNVTVTTANTAFGGTTGVTGAAGTIGRGGSAGYTGFNLNKVSYRTNPAGTSSRGGVSGGRGVKSF